MPHRMLLALPLLIAACNGAGSEPRPQGRPFDLAVEVHPLDVTGLSDTEADRILAAASLVLQTMDGPGDTPCPVTFRRSGPVGRLPSTMPLVIRSLEDFQAVSQNETGRRIVRVVSGIGWCGREAEGIIGCASIPGTVLVVRRELPVLEGSLWAHEFGHNRGLDHASERPRIMYFAMLGDQRMVTGQECAAFDGPEPAVAGGAPRFPGAATLVAETIPTDVTAFVAQRWPHGFPTTAATHFSPEEVRQVLPLLQRMDAVGSWENVVLLAGAAGGPGTAEDLIRFLRSAAWDPANPAAVQAKLAVPPALGYLANRLNDRAALAFLLEASRPGFWVQIASRATSVERRLGLERALASQTVTGLSLSGRPEARQRILALQGQVRQTGRPVLPGGVAAAGSMPDAAARDSRILQQALERLDNAAAGGLGAVRP